MQAPASPPWDIATSKKRKSSITSPRPSLPSTPVGSSLVVPRDEDGFTKVMTKEQRRKLKKVAKKTNLEAHVSRRRFDVVVLTCRNDRNSSSTLRGSNARLVLL